MASDEGVVGSGPRLVAKYKCACGYKWKVQKTRGGKKNCKCCYKEVEPYKIRPPKKGELGFTSPQLRVVQHEVGRMFGTFVCSNCNRSWYSAYAWSGKGQECQRCLTMNLPKELRPLLHQGSSNPDRPHDEAHCQRCQELGHSCKNAPPVVVSVTTTVETQNDDEGDDDVSVACTDTSEDSNDANQDDATEDVTPVGSEDEAERNENELEKEMENLKLEN
ncbi:hypothetical protein EMCRGX_G028426 [Ephydatia muelleri]